MWCSRKREAGRRGGEKVLSSAGGCSERIKRNRKQGKKRKITPVMHKNRIYSGQQSSVSHPSTFLLTVQLRKALVVRRRRGSFKKEVVVGGTEVLTCDKLIRQGQWQTEGSPNKRYPKAYRKIVNGGKLSMCLFPYQDEMAWPWCRWPANIERLRHNQSQQLQYVLELVCVVEEVKASSRYLESRGPWLQTWLCL